MGQVIGRFEKPYEVTLNWNDRITSSCSCPVEEMCKHGVALALAFISDDAENVDLERTRDEIDRLNEEEARQLLTDCMALEPRLTLLLPIGDDRHRVDDVLEHMDRSFSKEWKFGILASLCNEVDLAVRIARKWQGDGANEDRSRLVVGVLERILEYQDRPFDDYHQTHRRAIDMLTTFLLDFLGSMGEKELGVLFERLRDLVGRDEFDIGIYEMLEAVAEGRGIELDPYDP